LGEIACGDFAGHQLRFRRQKAWLDAHCHDHLSSRALHGKGERMDFCRLRP
jgi:hypothetical protein